MNWTDRSLKATVVIKTTSDDYVTNGGVWKEVTKNNIWNLINGGSYDVEYVPGEDIDTFIITERKYE